eukprot:Colp12_sorted_trinity150504_noHs@8952
MFFSDPVATLAPRTIFTMAQQKTIVSSNIFRTTPQPLGFASFKFGSFGQSCALVQPRREYVKKVKKYKMKTKGSCKKRFKITGEGEVKRWKAGKTHFNIKKRNSRLRRLRKSTLLTRSQKNKLKVLMPYAKIN